MLVYEKDSIESITLNEVIDLFKLRVKLGSLKIIVTVVVGRFGPYVRHDGKFVSLGEYDPMSIELDTCVELILAKRKSDAEKHIHTFDEMSRLFRFSGKVGTVYQDGKRRIIKFQKI